MSRNRDAVYRGHLEFPTFLRPEVLEPLGFLGVLLASNITWQGRSK